MRVGLKWTWVYCTDWGLLFKTVWGNWPPPHHYFNESGGWQKNIILCWPGHFIQFLRKQLIFHPMQGGVVGWQALLSVQIWTFHSIHNKKNFFVDWPLHPIYTTKRGLGLANMTSVEIWIFHAIPSKETLCKLIPTPWGWRIGTHEFSV